MVFRACQYLFADDFGDDFGDGSPMRTRRGAGGIGAIRGTRASEATGKAVIRDAVYSLPVSAPDGF